MCLVISLTSFFNFFIDYLKLVFHSKYSYLIKQCYMYILDCYKNKIDSSTSYIIFNYFLIIGRSHTPYIFTAPGLFVNSHLATSLLIVYIGPVPPTQD